LLIQRGTAPRKGEWSIPGGRIEEGESEAQAALRELYEETGVRAARAGDDAARAEFFPMSRVDALDMWPKTHSVINAAHALRKR